MDYYQALENLIRDIVSNEPLNISCIVGAGLSAGSGLSTFRGEDGMYKGKNPMELASLRGFIENPILVWTWYRDRIKKVFASEPNAGHIALVELEKMNLLNLIVTQNVDGLHLQAGQSPDKIFEIHGTLSKTRCFNNCGREYILTKEPDTVPVICKCGSYQRPAVVWFGEPVEIDLYSILDRIQEESNLLLIIGTSGVVYPVSQIPYILRKSLSIVNINPDITSFQDVADVSIPEGAETALPRIVAIINRLVSCER